MGNILRWISLQNSSWISKYKHLMSAETKQKQRLEEMFQELTIFALFYV